MVFDDALTRWGCSSLPGAGDWVGGYLSARVPGCVEPEGGSVPGAFWEGRCGVVFFLAGTRRFPVGGFSSEVRHIGR